MDRWVVQLHSAGKIYTYKINIYLQVESLQRGYDAAAAVVIRF